MAKRRATGQRTAEDWQREIRGWRRSGLTGRDYARKRGLKPTTLSWWAWKLRRDAQTRTVETVSLLPVEVVDDEVPTTTGVAWEVITASGDRMRGDGTVAPELAAALVDALMGRR